MIEISFVKKYYNLNILIGKSFYSWSLEVPPGSLVRSSAQR